MGELSKAVLRHIEGPIDIDEHGTKLVRETIWVDREAGSINIDRTVQLATPLEFIPISVHLVSTGEEE